MNDENKPVSKKPLQVSKAPPPITPVGSSPRKLGQFDTNVKGQPNWKHWRHVSTVEIWQGLLLSLNIEPPGNGWIIDNALGGTGDIPYEYLGSHGLTDEFIRRWRLVCNRLETLYASTSSPRKAELTNFLRLPLFATWAVEFEWGGLPPELVTLAKAASQDAPAAKGKAAPAKPRAKGGRPPSVDKKANAVRDMIARFERAAHIQFTPQALCGSAADLLDACQRFEKSNKIKPQIFSTSQDTFNGWLRKAGYSFPTGRTPDIEKNYWTQLVVKVTV